MQLLIIRKLFNHWMSEVRRLKTVRYQARRILNRSYDSIMNPKWLLEIKTTIFHLWRRYTALRAAIRQGKAAPAFSSPDDLYIEQWGSLRAAIIVKHMVNSAVNGRAKKLTLHRSIQAWVVVCRNLGVGKEREKMIQSYLTLANQHYEFNLLFKIMRLWNQVVRNHGKDFKRMKRCFLAIGVWTRADRKRRLVGEKVVQLLNRNRQRKAVKTMAAATFSVLTM